jgi:hypothetical protein
MNMFLRKNNVETFDSFFKMDWVTTFSEIFFEVSDKISYNLYRDDDLTPLYKNTLILINISLNNMGVENSREAYNLLGFVGDLGGVLEIIIAVFGILVFPFEEYSFSIKAIQKLYLAQTNASEGLFKTVSNKRLLKKSKHKLPSDYENTEVENVINTHFPIKLSKTQ